MRQFVGERDGEASGTGANVGDMQGFARQASVHMNFQAALTESGECYLHDVFGFRTRNQDGGCNFEIEAPEFLMAGQVLRR